jgi:mannose-1-phosphate guanylyltransferase
MRILTIMAGGGGVRFWPESRRARPKQFLALDGERSLLQATADRALPLFGWEHVSVITGADYAIATRSQLPELPPENLLLEPAARNTAACLGLAAAVWARRDPAAIMAVTPADHLISPDERFQRCLQMAMEAVEVSPESVYLLGIPPTRPATGYGYIEVAPLAEDAGSSPPPDLPVLRFREKPDAATATQFLTSGRHSWNAGIFIWQARRFLDLLTRYQPQIAEVVQRMAALGIHDNWDESTREEFRQLPSISVDHAVLEPLSREANSHLYVLPANFTWSDVGSWQTWPELWGHNEEGNTIRGPHVGVETTDCIVQTRPGHLVATFGVEGLLIVHTPTATLVARRDDETGVRRIVAEIERLDLGEVYG